MTLSVRSDLCLSARDGERETEIAYTQCAEDCGPHNCACEYGHLHLHKPQSLAHTVSTPVFFTKLKLYFNVCNLIFLTYTVEELTLSTKHANKILVVIFLTMKATILDTHGRKRKRESEIVET